MRAGHPSALRLLGAVCAPALALVLATGAAPAQASLFSDDEARKAILDLRARVNANDEAVRGRLTEIATQLAAQSTAAATAQAAQQKELADLIQGLRRSLVELNGQLETLRGDVARMRGEQEQLVREVAELQRRQKDAAQATDERLRKLEPMKITLDGQEFMAEPEEKRQFEQALAVMRSGEFDKAVTALGNFSRRYPGSGYADAVRYWTGNALYGKREYKEAAATLRAFVAGAPAHPRAPEALLAVANIQVESKDRAGARRTIDELVKAYPQSEAAAAGKERLAALR
jgi:tol-pal system protein YbgF